MTHWGCGPKVILIAVLSAFPVYFIQIMYLGDFIIPLSQERAFIISGVWFFLGIPVWFLGADGIRKNFEKSKLVTTGIFKYIQHPIYSSFLFFYIPAFVLATRSWIGFIIPFVFYFAFLFCIPFEEKYLESIFGDEYIAYKKCTGRVFPKLIIN